MLGNAGETCSHEGTGGIEIDKKQKTAYCTMIKKVCLSL